MEKKPTLSKKISGRWKSAKNTTLKSQNTDVDSSNKEGACRGACANEFQPVHSKENGAVERNKPGRTEENVECINQGSNGYVSGTQKRRILRRKLSKGISDAWNAARGNRQKSNEKRSQKDVNCNIGQEPACKDIIVRNEELSDVSEATIQTSSQATPPTNGEITAKTRSECEIGKGTDSVNPNLQGSGSYTANDLDNRSLQATEHQSNVPSASETNVTGNSNVVLKDCPSVVVHYAPESTTSTSANTSSESNQVLPKGVAAVANVGYNKLKYKVAKYIDNQEDALDQLKCYCEADHQTSFGIPREALDRVTKGLEFLQCLEKCQVLGPRNLLYLQLLLNTVALPDLVTEIEKFAERQSKQALHLQMERDTLATGVFSASFQIKGDRSQLLQSDADQFRKMLSERFDIDESFISIIGINDGSVILIFQLPCNSKGMNIVERLQSEAQNLKWLKDNNIISVSFPQFPCTYNGQEEEKNSSSNLKSDGLTDESNTNTGIEELEQILTALTVRSFLSLKEHSNKQLSIKNFAAAYLVRETGGRLHIPSAGVSLYVPPDALPDSSEPQLVYIYAQEPSDTIFTEKNSSQAWVNSAVTCGPSNLTFHKSVFLTIPFKFEVDSSKTHVKGYSKKTNTDGDWEEVVDWKDTLFVTQKRAAAFLLEDFSHIKYGCTVETSSDEVALIKVAIFAKHMDDSKCMIWLNFCDIDTQINDASNVGEGQLLISSLIQVEKYGENIKVAIRGLDPNWDFEKTAGQEIECSKLWFRESCGEASENRARMDFTVELKEDDEHAMSCPSNIHAIVDVFQGDDPRPRLSEEVVHDFNHSSFSNTSERHEISGSTEDTQVEIRLEVVHFKPLPGCSISNEHFRELCVLLESEGGDADGKHWEKMAVAIGITEFKHISRIGCKAKQKLRSPAAVILDFFFKDSSNNPLVTLRLLSNICLQIGNYSAKEVVDKAIRANEKRSRTPEPHYQGNQSLTDICEIHSPSNSCDEDSLFHDTLCFTPVHEATHRRKLSLRTSSLFATHQNRLGKLNASSEKHKRLSNEVVEEDDGIAVTKQCSSEGTSQEYCTSSFDDSQQEGKADMLDVKSDQKNAISPEMDYMDEIVDEFNPTIFSQPTLNPKDNDNRDSGISSISDGSRDSWKSVQGQESRPYFL